MGKRGPAPKGEYEGKSKVFSTRIRPDTREKLETAAQESGRSLSQEVEFRLRRSFVEDERIVDVFGSRRNYALLRMIASIMETAGGSKEDIDWVDDTYYFDQVASAIEILLRSIRPQVPTRADRPPPEQREWEAIQNVMMLLERVRKADPTIPIEKRSSDQHPVAVLKADLGRIANRPDIVWLKEEELKRVYRDYLEPRSYEEARIYSTDEEDQ